MYSFNKGNLTVFRLTNLWPLKSESNWNLQMLLFEEGGKLEYLEKNLSNQGKTDNKLNPHMMPGPGIEPWLHWWEASILTTAPPLPSLMNLSLAKVLLQLYILYCWISQNKHHPLQSSICTDY